LRNKVKKKITNKIGISKKFMLKLTICILSKISRFARNDTVLGNFTTVSMIVK